MISRFNIICVTLLILLFSFSIFQARKISVLSKEKDQAIEFSNSKNDSLTRYKNKLGTMNVKTSVIQLTPRSAKELKEDYRLDFVKSFEGVNKRMNNLENALYTSMRLNKELAAKLRDTLITLQLNGKDTTVNAKFYSHKDTFGSEFGLAIGDTFKTSRIERVPLQAVLYWERKKILGLKIGRKKWSAEASSSNPSIIIDTLSVVKVQKIK